MTGAELCTGMVVYYEGVVLGKWTRLIGTIVDTSFISGYAILIKLSPQDSREGHDGNGVANIHMTTRGYWWEPIGCLEPARWTQEDV